MLLLAVLLVLLKTQVVLASLAVSLVPVMLPPPAALFGLGALDAGTEHPLSQPPALLRPRWKSKLLPLAKLLLPPLVVVTPASPTRPRKHGWPFFVAREEGKEMKKARPNDNTRGCTYNVVVYVQVKRSCGIIHPLQATPSMKFHTHV